MRCVRVLGFAVACGIVATATPAMAIFFGLEIVSGATGPGGAPRVGDTVVVDLTADTETETLQAWFLQVDHPGQMATAASVEPFVWVGGVIATPLGVPLPNDAAAGEATGQWAMIVGPSSAIPPGQAFVYGQITLELRVPGVVAMAPSEAVGAIGGGGPCICLPEPPDLSLFGSFEVVPEPGTGLLVGLGLVGLAVGRRRPCFGPIPRAPLGRSA